MITYVGQTRGRAMVKKLAAAGIGECTQRGELPPRRKPWFHDNGAFRDHQAGVAFDGVRWLRDQWRIRDRGLQPDFIVCPDEVGAPTATYRRSALERFHCAPGIPVYFVVQEGMHEHDVDEFLDLMGCDGQGFGGIFVGGETADWKWSTAHVWRHLATRYRIKLHIGRVSTPELVHAAWCLGADSVDSSFPLWQLERLDAWIAAAVETREAP